MQPTTPATTIRIDSPKSGGGSCNYEYAAFKGIVSVVFVGTIPQGVSISDVATQALGGANLPPGGKITTTPVSDVGDQALFITAAIPIAGKTLKMDFLDIIYGAIFFDCNNPNVGSIPDATELNGFTQVAQLVISRL